MPPRILVIAGSDCSGGAGIQADLKTAQAFGVYAQTAITAVTVQDTNGVKSVNPVAPEIVRGQIDAALNDIGADAIKIGMLANGRIAAAVADALEACDIPLVLDTVLLSSSGAPLLDEAGITVLKKRLMRRAALVTPNWPETEALTGILPVSEHRLRNAAMVFKMLGSENVLFKGGHGEGEVVRRAVEWWRFHRFRSAAPDRAPHPRHRLHPGHRYCLRAGAEAKFEGCRQPRPGLCAGGDPDGAGIGFRRGSAQS